MSTGEPGVRYPFKAGPFSSHAQVLKALGPGGGRHALDVGCAQGDVAAALVDAGWRVEGIEPHQPDASLAKARGLEVIELPVEDALHQLAGPYDAIIAADVLEHLPDPTRILRELSDLLADDGLIVVSLPNIAHLSVRLQLLFGKFNYQPHGILDRTHLRFFTRKTAIAMFNEVGLTLTSISPTPVPLERLLPQLGSHPRFSTIHRLNHAISRCWPRGLAFQFILVAHRKPGPDRTGQ